MCVWGGRGSSKKKTHGGGRSTQLVTGRGFGWSALKTKFGYIGGGAFSLPINNIGLGIDVEPIALNHVQLFFCVCGGRGG